NSMRDVELGNRTLTTNEASRTRLALGRIRPYFVHWRPHSNGMVCGFPETWFVFVQLVRQPDGMRGRLNFVLWRICEIARLKLQGSAEPPRKRTSSRPQNRKHASFKGLLGRSLKLSTE